MSHSDAKNPLSQFLLGKMLDSHYNSITLSHEAAYQIIDELERQDAALDQIVSLPDVGRVSGQLGAARAIASQARLKMTANDGSGDANGN